VVERFGNSLEIDIVLAAQRFYQTHEDAYDYLVIYNNADLVPCTGAVACESTVRSSGSGWGVPTADNGQQYGSESRLRSVLNMGDLKQYPKDPNAFVPSRAGSQDTPLTVLGHEAGHLFLARASIPDPNDSSARPMLGFGGVHWSFVFDSEASLDEGERITDRGAAVSLRVFSHPRSTQGYSPLDQYLMGLRTPGDVPDTFVVTGYRPTCSPPFTPYRASASTATVSTSGSTTSSRPRAAVRPTTLWRSATTVSRSSWWCPPDRKYRPRTCSKWKLTASSLQRSSTKASTGNAVADTTLNRQA